MSETLSNQRAVISVIGPDRKGVVASFTGYLAGQGANILEVEQKVVSNTFVMDMLVDVSDLAGGSTALRDPLTGLGQGMGLDVAVHTIDDPAPRIAVLVTREPHCLTQLIEDAVHGHFRGEIACVLSNHDMLRPRAEAAGIPFEFQAIDKNSDTKNKAAHFAWLRERLEHFAIDVVVLARYMQVVPPAMVAAYPRKIINIHPSLLPAFPGAKPYHAAWGKGVRFAGCTCHYVTDELDQGPIITQGHFDIDVGHDTALDVQRKGRQLEAHLLSDALRDHLDQRLLVIDNKVVMRPGLSRLLVHAE